ncbi:transposase orfA for insertion sequence element [Rhodococcus wratislaviensis IFP 2016]|nr:transposase orfA for insertion sequence element [Rhodococcus wratislaviensis IFP 2016]
MVPDALWEMVEPLTPPFVARPQGGGSAPADDRAVFTEIVYVLTSGCAWRHLPPSFGVTVPTAHRRFSAWVRDGGSRNCIARCSIGSVARANSTGRQRSWMRQAFGRKRGITDRPQPGRPRQEGIEDPRPVRNEWNPTGRGCDRGEHPRQHDAATDGGSDSGNEVQARTTAPQAGKASRRQGLRLRHSPTVAARTRPGSPATGA